MKNVIRILLWSAVIIWMGIIFSFSSQTASKSHAQSTTFIRTVDSSIQSAPPSEQEIRVGTKQRIVRKYAHILLYAVLGMLCMGALLTHRLQILVRPCLAVLICTVYGASDEWHQTMVAGRSGEIRDVGIDALGALVGVLLIFVISILIQRKKTKVG